MKTKSTLIAIASIAAVLVAAVACKNPIKDKVEEINASEAPSLNLAAAGTSIASGGSYNLGATALATTRSGIFTLSNSGKSDLEASVSASGNFAVTSQPAGTIAPGSSSTFVVNFTPTSPEGIKSGTVTISSNDPKNESYKFAVTGLAHTLILPQTGQTASKAVGDDGYYRKGASLPAPRFTDKGNDTFKDNLTGLIWTMAANWGGSRTWANALAYATTQNTAVFLGISNWRIPNRNEIRSLIDYGQASTPQAWLATQSFTNIGATYWTSTEDSTDTSYAWLIDLTTGALASDSKGSSYGIWLVSTPIALEGTVKLPATGRSGSIAGSDGNPAAGEAWPSTRFVARGDGTISDAVTGLRWQSDSKVLKTWAEALAAARASSLGGFTDWRVPNMNELASLYNAGEADSATWLNNRGFTGIKSDGYYWSSTAMAFGGPADNRWELHFTYGNITQVDRASTRYFLLVRSDE